MNVPSEAGLPYVWWLFWWVVAVILYGGLYLINRRIVTELDEEGLQRAAELQAERQSQPGES